MIIFSCDDHSCENVVGTMAESVRALAWTGDRTVPAGFKSRCGNFASELWQFRLIPLCQCLSEETLKSCRSFYLVCMPGEVKDPTSLHWKCVTVVDSTTHSNLTSRVRLCGGKHCPALISEEEKKKCDHDTAYCRVGGITGRACL